MSLITLALAPFLEGLFADGKALVDAPTLLSAEDVRESRAILEREEAKVRAEFPGQAPTLHLAAALWGAEAFHRMCQLTVYRSTTAEMVAVALSEACPAAVAAERHYAVDLTWRFLPDLYRYAQGAAPDDPLVTAMRAVGGQWPLSSVGLAGIQATSLEEILDHEGLFRVYIDRVMQRKDTTRLANPRVFQGVLASVGIHTQFVAEWKRDWPQALLDLLTVHSQEFERIE